MLINRILLVVGLLLGTSLLINKPVQAQVSPSTSNTPSATSDQAGGPNIDPNIERRDISEFDIDSENIEVGIFAGIINIEDFSSSVTTGLRLSYHINENMFIETSYAQATAGKTSFEILSGGLPFLTQEQRDFSYYDISAAYNLNGEVFFTDAWVFNTDFFLIVGAGATEFGGDERLTLNAGAGYRILVTDYLSVRFDVRDYVFNSDIIGAEKSVHNLTFTLSTSFFF
ncbi:MAG: outer membrane beta-barrel protein [Kangiellaceae bacterium]|jgi:outer membrane beta-barrel protein